MTIGTMTIGTMTGKDTYLSQLAGILHIYAKCVKYVQSLLTDLAQET